MATPQPHVIILAQGQQTRLPELGHPKQLLALPRAGGVQILARTLVILRELSPWANVTVVAKNELAASIATSCYWESHELADPGNSSLKGVSRYLDHRRDLMNLGALEFEPSMTTVLLGDVVYSWDCLATLLLTPGPAGLAFVGTSDLSESAGEIWGIQWLPSADAAMTDWLKRALRRHPPFPAYQCGQLRQWLFTARRAMQDELRSVERGNAAVPFVAIDDYTKDFDVPADLELLEDVSRAAADDDAQHGLRW